MTTASVDGDLNELIKTAVNARVEASVLEALSGDETIGKMVVAALQQVVEVPSSGYSKAKVTFLNHLLTSTIRAATKNAVEKVLVEEQQLIEDEVRKQIRKNAPEIAAAMAGQLAETAAKGYGVSVSLRLPGAND